jgi:hypothetical protein
LRQIDINEAANGLQCLGIALFLRVKPSSLEEKRQAAAERGMQNHSCFSQ